MPPFDCRSAPVLIEDQSCQADELWTRVRQLLDEGQTVRLRSPLLKRLTDVLGEEYDGRVWLVLKPRSSGGAASKLARCRDVAASALGLVLISPLLLLFGLLIKLTSAGPVFFSTTVVGRRRQLFRWYKLRSMSVAPAAKEQSLRKVQFEAYVKGENSREKGAGPQFKVIEPSRVTRLGRWLRKYSLDELPQLWNVLRGEMSLVGPRPCLPYEARFFQGWREHRFDVPAGLTGVWQVFGRGQTSFDETAAMDVYYVFRKSFAFDLYLIARTLGKVFKGEGAM